MLTVAYLGPQRTNTHFAAMAKFGKGHRYVHDPSIDDVFHRVEREEADCGVVPVENSLGGAVTHTLDRFIEFMKSPVRIQGEIEQPIKHYLIVRRKKDLRRIRIIYSHPQAFTQCQHWLNRFYSKAFRWETSSTAQAIHYLVFKSFSPRWKLSERAAIGPLQLAKEHALYSIEIPQEKENKTRFLILGLNPTRMGRRNKTSVLFALKDKPGALYDALSPFKKNQINLTKIESRPSQRKAWEYLFFIDIEGHETEPKVKRALKALQKHTARFRVLGSYPISGRR